MIEDVIEESRVRLAELKPKSADDIRYAGDRTIAFSGKMLEELDELRKFLWSSVYRHPRIVLIMNNAERIVSDLFRHYSEHPGELPKTWQITEKGPIEEQASQIRDFVAGMTDRFAVGEHRRLFDVTPDLR